MKTLHVVKLLCGVAAVEQTFGLVGEQPRRARTTASLHLKNKRNAEESLDSISEQGNDQALGRRKLLRSLALVASAALTTSSAVDTLPSKWSAHAYEKSFPIELQAIDAGDLDSRQRKVNTIRKQQQQQQAAAASSLLTRPLSAALWGAALWFLAGSRSNPLVTPIANALYDPNQEEWLKDRNDGLFANPPAPFFIVLAIVFFALGSVTDMAMVGLLADDDNDGRNTSMQLAGVSLIGGAFWDLGRIASGEKAATRDESNRATELAQEFAQFAADRLRPGGNVHRNEVVKSFRRYFAKYRQAENEEYALSDLEIERLLRSWSRTQPGVDMSSAGFYSGIQINTEADVFVQR